MIIFKQFIENKKGIIFKSLESKDVTLRIIDWHTYNTDGSVATKKRYETGSRIFGKGTLVDYFLLNEGWTRKDDWLHTDTYHLLGYEKKVKNI